LAAAAVCLKGHENELFAGAALDAADHAAFVGNLNLGVEGAAARAVDASFIFLERVVVKVEDADETHVRKPKT